MVLRIWPIFGSVFRFLLLKIADFQFWCFVRFAGFLHLAFGFRFLSTMMAVFWIFLSNTFYDFSGFGKEVAPCSHVKNVIPRDHFQLEEYMTSLVSLAAVIWVVTAAKQPG